MINSSIINSRIEKLRHYLEILEELGKEKLEDFKADYRIYGSAERYLHLSIECILDIGNHIVSRKDFKKPETYRDIILILGENSILPKEFSLRIAKMAGLRNILVHEYLIIDKELIFTYLHESISDFKQYIKYILSYISKD